MDTRPCFIYAITHLASGRCYIGSCLHPKRRWIEHRSDLKCQRHHCSYLQRAWNKYGAAAFAFSILSNLENNDYQERAKAELEAISTHECFNSRLSNLGRTNFINSEATRAKINFGITKKQSDDQVYLEWLRERGKSLAEFARSPERRALQSVLSKELWTDPKHRAQVSTKLALHWNKIGVREQHSERVKATKRDPETIRRHSEATKMQWADPNGGLRNRKQTRWADPEAKARQAEKMRIVWQRRREQKP
jgi:group I intron endonuclease